MGAERETESRQLVFWPPCKEALKEPKQISYRQLVSWPSKTAVMLQPLHPNYNLSEKTPIEGPDVHCAEPGNISGYCCGQLLLWLVHCFSPLFWQEGPASFPEEFIPFGSGGARPYLYKSAMPEAITNPELSSYLSQFIPLKKFSLGLVWIGFCHLQLRV